MNFLESPPFRPFSIFPTPSAFQHAWQYTTVLPVIQEYCLSFTIIYVGLVKSGCAPWVLPARAAVTSGDATYLITLSQKKLVCFHAQKCNRSRNRCFLHILLHSDQVSVLCPFSWVKWLCSWLQHQFHHFRWTLLCWIGDFGRLQAWSRWRRASPPANTRNWCQVVRCLRIRHHITSWIPRNQVFSINLCHEVSLDPVVGKVVFFLFFF